MAEYLATNEFAGTGAVMQVEVNFAGARLDTPSDPAPYFEDDDLYAEIVVKATDTTLGSKIPVDLIKVNALTWRTSEAVPSYAVLRVYRLTDIEQPKVDFVSLQVVTESDLDTATRQSLYAVMEARDGSQLALDYAQNAQDVAVRANVTANDAKDIAADANTISNRALSEAQAAVRTANSADEKSNKALEDAEAAEKHATNVEKLTAVAQEAAEAAEESAAAASTAANEAVTTANGVDGKAQSALDASAEAKSLANSAKTTADGIDAKATQAVNTANSAQYTANKAESAVQSATSGKQDANSKLSDISAVGTGGADYSNILGVNASGKVAPFVATTYTTGTLWKSADAAGFRNVIGLGPEQDVEFTSVLANVRTNNIESASGGTISVKAHVDCTGNVSAAGQLHARGGGLNVRAVNANANAHIWMQTETGVERGLMYADPSSRVRIRANGGNGGEGILINGNNSVSINTYLDCTFTGQTVFGRSGVSAGSSMYRNCQLQLLAPDGGIPALGFHSAGEVASSLWLNTDGNLWLYKHSGANELMLSEATLLTKLAEKMAADQIGCVSLMYNQTGRNIGLNEVVDGSMLRFSSHNNVSGTSGSGSWRSLGWSNAQGVSCWMRVA